MKDASIAERIQKLFFSFKPDTALLRCKPAYFSRRDAAVLKVAMMIAALDGAVTDAELASFEKLAKKCRGYTAQSAKVLFREGLRAAGYLELASRTLSAQDVQGIFLDEAKAILSDSFSQDDAVGIRSAFVTWMAMAMSDGDYSANERKAIAAFASHVQEQINEREEANRRRQSLSPAFAAAYRENGPKGVVFTAAFFTRAESILADLNRDEASAAAEAAVTDLIAHG